MGALVAMSKCKRKNGTLRAAFSTKSEAEAFAADWRNVDYHADIPVQCVEPGCGQWHLSQFWWPDAVAQKARDN